MLVRLTGLYHNSHHSLMMGEVSVIFEGGCMEVDVAAYQIMLYGHTTVFLA